MALSIPTLDEITERIVADYKARLPNDDVSELKDNWKRLRTFSVALLNVFYQLEVTYRDLFPDTASLGALDRLGAIWGVTRKPATPAQKADALRITGTVSSAYTIGDQLTSDGGLTYQLNESGTIPAALFVDVDVIAVDTGSETKLNAGEVLRFTSPPSGIDTAAELQLDIDEDGADEESDGAYRVRLLNRIGQPGMGGNANDYAQWALELAIVAEAYVYPLRAGYGSVDVAALHDAEGSARLLDATDRANLQTQLDDNRPVSVKACRVLEVTANEQDCDLTIEARPGAAYAWDWDDSGGALLVSTWTAGTRTLKFTANRPSDMDVGDRLVISNATPGVGGGEVLEIEAFGAGADEVVLKTAPTVTPAASDSVYAGGNLTETVRDAVLAHYKTLGPAVGDYGTGEWDSDLDPRRIEAAVVGLEGVRRALTVTPSVTATPSDPAYPNDDTIELVVPREVLVRRM